MKIARLCLVALCLSCHGSKPPPPLDAVLPLGTARAGKVTRESELIGGPVAYGRVGDVWKIYNSKVRFLVQDVGAAVGLDLYGGNLIDADLARDGSDGRNGNDLFREMFPIVGLRALKATSIEVISDGTAGGSAILRIHGTDAPTDILPQIDGLAEPLGGDITLDYELAPDVPYLKLTTRYHALPGQSLGALALGDFVSFGASNAVISPENGFSGSASNVSFLATSAEGTSYGYVYPQGPLTLPVVDASGTVTLLSTAALPVDGTAEVTRYLIVGGGDAASVTGPMYALRGTTTAALSGRVTDGKGGPVAGARVTLFKAPYTDAADCVDQAKTSSDGSYRFDVPPGAYVAIASGIGRLHGAATPVTLGASGAALDLPVGAVGTVQLDVGEVRGGARRPVPAKVSLIGVGVEAPDPRFGPDPTEDERFGLAALALTPDGHGTIDVKPGTYRAVISRGPEYELATVDAIAVAPGGTTLLSADLARVVDTGGWLAGDYHQHSQGSIDSPVPIRQRVIEDLAEGIEFPAATDHDNLTDYRPHIAALSAAPFMNAMIGNEVSVNGVGHFNGYPLTIDETKPYEKVGAKYWARQSIRALTAKVHAEPAPAVLHVSHPRTKSLAGYFNSVRYDPTTGKAAIDFPIEGFDAVEVNADLGQPADFLPAGDAALHKRATQPIPSGVPALRDWFSFLNQGQAVCALGNSDTHQRNGGTGWPRSFVQVGSDDPASVTEGQVVAAIRAQKVTVSNGPFVTVTLNGQAKLGLKEAVSLAGAASAKLGIRIQAPTWIDVSSLEVYANGRPLSLARIAPGTFEERPDGAPGTSLASLLDASDAKGKVVRLDGIVTVKPARDTWYVVVVRGARPMTPVAGGTPYAYTNPVYVDLGGDGWSAPGL